MANAKKSNLALLLVMLAILFNTFFTWIAEEKIVDTNDSNNILKYALISAGLGVFAVYVTGAFVLIERPKKNKQEESIRAIEKDLKEIKKALNISDKTE